MPRHTLEPKSKGRRPCSSKGITDCINNLDFTIPADFRALFLSESIITKVFLSDFSIITLFVRLRFNICSLNFPFISNFTDRAIYKYLRGEKKMR